MADAKQSLSHLSTILQLNERDVDKQQLLTLSEDDAKRMLERYEQEEKRTFTEQDAEKLIKSLDNKTQLPRLLKIHDVLDPGSTLDDDDSRKERLKYQLMKKHTDARSMSELLPNLQETAKGFEEACKSLGHIGRNVLSFVFGDLIKRAPSLIKSVTFDIPKCEELTKKTLDRLDCGECPIVVTGEVSTGKSSFLNLLLQGTDIELPNTEQETTSCICEIRHSSERRAVVHRRFVPQGEKPTTTIPNWTTEELNYHVNLDRHQSGKHPNSKVEIYAPVELLKHGIVLVDTPGVESENKEMTQFVVDYLQHSVGFIYILNKAIDVHKIHRLFDTEESIAREQLNAETSDELSERMSRKTLFIVNKWDQVKDQERMLAEVKRKLQSQWPPERCASIEAGAALPNDSLEAHVLPLSVTRDRDHLMAGYKPERLIKVVESLEKIVPSHMELQLRKHYRWLLFVISRVETHAQKYLSIADHIDDGERDEVLGEATRKLAKLRELGRQQSSKFQKYVQSVDLSEIADKLAAHLQDRCVRARIITWKSEECPEAIGSYDEIKTQAKSMVEQRVQTELENWEHDAKLFREKRRDIEQTVATLMEPIDKEVGVLTRQLNPNNPLELDVPGFRFSFLPRPGFFGNVLLLLGRFFTLKSDLDERDKSVYFDHKVESMQDLAVATLEALKGRNQVRNLAFSVLGLREAPGKFKQLVEHALAALQREIKNLENHDAADSLRSTYLPIQKTSSELYNRLQAWEIKHLFEGRQLKSGDVVVGEVCLGIGKIAEYRPGTIKAERHKLVTCKSFAAKDDYPAAFQDFKWLRDHHHPHIAKAIGLIQVKKETELIVVLEECVQSLDTWLADKRRWGKKGGNLGTILQFATETCQALNFLHSEGMVHGDLMPQTILLANRSTSRGQVSGSAPASKFVVKLCHSGVKEGTTVVIGTDEQLGCKYFSPELIPKKGRKSRYHPSADVFSFGVVLSDMWFGPDDKEFTTRYLHPKDKTDASSIGEGFKARRAKTVSKPEPESFTDIKAATDDSPEVKRPPSEYHELMLDCRGNLSGLPGIDKVQNQLQAITKTYEGDGQTRSDT